MPLNNQGDCPKCKRAGRTETATMCSAGHDVGLCMHCDRDCPKCIEEDDRPTCESCGELATRITTDDVDVCEECWQVLVNES